MLVVCVSLEFVHFWQTEKKLVLLFGLRLFVFIPVMHMWHILTVDPICNAACALYTLVCSVVPCLTVGLLENEAIIVRKAAFNTGGKWVQMYSSLAVRKPRVQLLLQIVRLADMIKDGTETQDRELLWTVSGLSHHYHLDCWDSLAALAAFTVADGCWEVL